MSPTLNDRHEHRIFRTSRHELARPSPHHPSGHRRADRIGHHHAGRLNGPRDYPTKVIDVERNVGWINVGQDRETAPSAIESLRPWWRGDGALPHPDADQLLISADGGDGSGYRVRL